MPNGYNQYIGMRYVPLVMGTWSDTVNYEPLVVVSYNGNSYVSKTYVPAGTLPTNETYWMLAANYNAQVEQYRQEVRQYQQTVDEFDGDISALQNTVDGLVNWKTGANNSIINLEADMAHMQVLVGNLNFNINSSTALAVNAYEDVTGNTYDATDTVRFWKGKYPNGTVRVIPTGFFGNYCTLENPTFDIVESGTVSDNNYSCRITPHARIRNVSNGTYAQSAKLRAILEFTE